MKESYVQNSNIKQSRYQLRKAAGLYWLIDMEQTGAPFRKPIPMNETGAYIWKLLERGQMDMAVSELCERYQTGEAQMRQDVERFVNMLRERGISI